MSASDRSIGHVTGTHTAREPAIATVRTYAGDLARCGRSPVLAASTVPTMVRIMRSWVSTLGLRSLGLGSAIPDVIVGRWLAVVSLLSWLRSHRAGVRLGDLRCLEFHHGR